MANFSQEEFLRRAIEKMPDPQPCPFCGGTNYTAYPKFSNISIQDNFGAIEIGRSIPCGILMCSNCGHINLFSLGRLGFDFSKEGDTNE